MSQTKIDSLVADFVETDSSAGGKAAIARLAAQQLLDLMVRPDTCVTTMRALAARMSQPSLDADARARLRSLQDWAEPKVACEEWHFSRPWDVWYVPAPRRGTHYDKGLSETQDYINGCNLHSATGKLLPEGDYVVGEADSFGEQNYFSRLVYLPMRARPVDLRSQRPDPKIQRAVGRGNGRHAAALHRLQSHRD